MSIKERTIAIRSDDSAMSEILAFIKYDKAEVEAEERCGGRCGGDRRMRRWSWRREV
jgi:hypothetical protein